MAQQLEGTPQVIRAVEMAVEQVNGEGGLETADGRRITVELRVDSGFDSPEAAVVAMRRLIYQEQVVGLIGPSLSRNAIPAADVAEKVGIPMISPGATHPDATAGKRWAFRTNATDDDQGRIMARFALEELDARTAAVLYNEAEPFFRNLGELFRDAFVAGGGRIVAVETYSFGEQDFGPAMARIGAKGPQALFIAGSDTEAMVQLRVAREQGLDVFFLGTDAWTLATSEEKTAALEGVFAFQHWHPDLAASRPEAAEFVRAYRQRYGERPKDVTVLAWGAAGLLLEAARHGPDPTSIREHLAGIRDYQGATGSFTFAGHGGDPPKSAMIIRIENGQHMLFEELEP